MWIFALILFKKLPIDFNSKICYTQTVKTFVFTFHRIYPDYRGGVKMENFDFNAILDVFKKIGDVLGKVDWEGVFNTVKDVIGKIVEFVSGIAGK